jgi:hypothetical protein
LWALRFIETFDDTISLQPGEPIDPKDPIELIDLVLEQTIGLFDLFHTAQILAAHLHTGMAFDLFRYARHGMETPPSSCRIMSTEARTICGLT